MLFRCGEQVLKMAEWYVGKYHMCVCKFLWLVKLIDLYLQKKIYAFAMCHFEW